MKGTPNSPEEVHSQADPAAPYMLPVAFRPERAAKELGISRSMLYRELRSGRLKSIRIGRSRLITFAQLVQYVDSFDEHGNTPEADAQ